MYMVDKNPDKASEICIRLSGVFSHDLRSFFYTQEYAIICFYINHSLMGFSCLLRVCVWILCCLLTPGCWKDTQCHVWPHYFLNTCCYQIGHWATYYILPCDCRWPLYMIFLGDCVGTYVLPYLLFDLWDAYLQRTISALNSQIICEWKHRGNAECVHLWTNAYKVVVGRGGGGGEGGGE